MARQRGSNYPNDVAQESPESWKKLYQFNHDILYRVLLDPNLQDILDQAYPRLSGPVYVPRMAASSG
eukprot:scaffold644_cov353-Prasinococcus_capsulatus_cf.AAC.8